MYARRYYNRMVYEHSSRFGKVPGTLMKAAYRVDSLFYGVVSHLIRWTPVR